MADLNEFVDKLRSYLGDTTSILAVELCNFYQAHPEAKKLLGTKKIKALCALLPSLDWEEGSHGGLHRIHISAASTSTTRNRNGGDAVSSASWVDRELACVLCSKPFVFESGEQRYFHERGYRTPGKCPACRGVGGGGGRRCDKDSAAQNDDAHDEPRTSGSGTVGVNVRALINNTLARYPVEYFALKEIIQNADDCKSTTVTVRLTREAGGSRPIKKIVVENDGEAFSAHDRRRIVTIAEGNEDSSRVGVFGVGFFSVFALSDRPSVRSGSWRLAFTGYTSDSQLAYEETFDQEASEHKGSSVSLPLTPNCAATEWTTEGLKDFLVRPCLGAAHLSTLRLFEGGECVWEVRRELRWLVRGLPCTPPSDDGASAASTPPPPGVLLVAREPLAPGAETELPLPRALRAHALSQGLSQSRAFVLVLPRGTLLAVRWAPEAGSGRVAVVWPRGGRRAECGPGAQGFLRAGGLDVAQVRGLQQLVDGQVTPGAAAQALLSSLARGQPTSALSAEEEAGSAAKLPGDGERPLLVADSFDLGELVVRSVGTEATGRGELVMPVLRAAGRVNTKHKGHARLKREVFEATGKRPPSAFPVTLVFSPSAPASDASSLDAAATQRLLGTLFEASKKKPRSSSSSGGGGGGGNGGNRGTSGGGGFGLLVVGQPTLQTSGARFHVATCLYPTMERTQLDLSQAALRWWNREALQLVGSLARARYDHAVVAACAEGDALAVVSALRAHGVAANTTPKRFVGDTLADAFLRGAHGSVRAGAAYLLVPCRPPSSSSGGGGVVLVAATEAHVLRSGGDGDASAWTDLAVHHHVLLPEALTAAPEFVDMLERDSLVAVLGPLEVLEALRTSPVPLADALRVLRWALDNPAVLQRDLRNRTPRDVFRSLSLLPDPDSDDNGGGSGSAAAVRLADVVFFSADPHMTAPGLGRPAGLAPAALARAFGAEQLQRGLGLQRLSVAEWLRQHLADPSLMQDPSRAPLLVQALCRMALAPADAAVAASLLRDAKCLLATRAAAAPKAASPKAKLVAPGQCYFAAAAATMDAALRSKVFVLADESAFENRALLGQLGVRDRPEPSFLLPLLQAKQLTWSAFCQELCADGRGGARGLQAADLAALQAFVAEHAPGQYAPDTQLVALGFPCVGDAWGGEAFEPEHVALLEALGLPRRPSFEALLDLVDRSDRRLRPAVQGKVLAYVEEHLAHYDEAARASARAFLPTTAAPETAGGSGSRGSTAPLRDVFLDETPFHFPTVAPDFRSLARRLGVSGAPPLARALEALVATVEGAVSENRPLSPPMIVAMLTYLGSRVGELTADHLAFLGEHKCVPCNDTATMGHHPNGTVAQAPAGAEPRRVLLDWNASMEGAYFGLPPWLGANTAASAFLAAVGVHTKDMAMATHLASGLHEHTTLLQRFRLAPPDCKVHALGIASNAAGVALALVLCNAVGNSMLAQLSKVPLLYHTGEHRWISSADTFYCDEKFAADFPTIAADQAAWYCLSPSNSPLQYGSAFKVLGAQPASSLYRETLAPGKGLCCGGRLLLGRAAATAAVLEVRLHKAMLRVLTLWLQNIEAWDPEEWAAFLVGASRLSAVRFEVVPQLSGFVEIARWGGLRSEALDSGRPYLVRPAARQSQTVSGSLEVLIAGNAGASPESLRFEDDVAYALVDMLKMPKAVEGLLVRTLAGQGDPAGSTKTLSPSQRWHASLSKFALMCRRQMACHKVPTAAAQKTPKFAALSPDPPYESLKLDRVVLAEKCNPHVESRPPLLPPQKSPFVSLQTSQVEHSSWNEPLPSAHEGDRWCEELGCDKSAQGSTSRCKAHAITQNIGQTHEKSYRLPDIPSMASLEAFAVKIAKKPTPLERKKPLSRRSANEKSTGISTPLQQRAGLIAEAIVYAYLQNHLPHVGPKNWVSSARDQVLLASPSQRAEDFPPADDALGFDFKFLDPQGTFTGRSGTECLLEVKVVANGESFYISDSELLCARRVGLDNKDVCKQVYVLCLVEGALLASDERGASSSSSSSSSAPLPELRFEPNPSFLVSGEAFPLSSSSSSDFAALLTPVAYRATIENHQQEAKIADMRLPLGSSRQQSRPKK